MLGKSCIGLINLYFKGVDDVEILKIRLGEVELSYDPKKLSFKDLKQHFEKLGFGVIVDPDILLVEKIKLAAIELIHYAFNANSLIRNSDYISEKLQVPYERISKVFSKVTGITLEKYLIMVKIEKAKELIANNEYTLSEISYMLGYSSVQYLSNQFKKISGVTVSEFKTNPHLYRRPIEEILS